MLDGAVGFGLSNRTGRWRFFGEATLFVDVRHACDTIALKRTELLVLFRHDFEQFAKRSPTAAAQALFAFARILAERSMDGNESGEANQNPGDDGLRCGGS